MPQSDRDLVTVSPPTFDRVDFARVDQDLAANHPAYDRTWLMDRFSEGLEIRMLRGTPSGFVMFQPGRLAWRPILGADRAIVVHDLRVAEGAETAPALRRLWSNVEDFARYYGYSAILALGGEADGLIAAAHRPGRGWMRLEDDGQGARLWGRVLHGPMALPRLPQDWAARAARLGAGVVLQTTEEPLGWSARVNRIDALLWAHGIPLRVDRLRDGPDVQARAVAVDAAFSVVVDGVRVGGADMTDAAILAAARAARKA